MTTKMLAVLVAIPLLLTGCGEFPEPVRLDADPADGSRPARERGYRSVTEGARDYKVVGPKPWGQSNEAVTPNAK